MGRKKLSLNGYWLHVHAIHDELVEKNGKYNFEDSIGIADGLWKVKQMRFFKIYLFSMCQRV